MENPAEEIASVVEHLTASANASIQKDTLKRYFMRDAAFRHPLVHIDHGYNSRDKILGVYQWYRVMSPKLSITVHRAFLDAPSSTLIVYGTQKFHIRWSPFAPAPANLLVRLTLVQEAGLYYISKQEDFYHPEDFLALLVPPLLPVLRLILELGGMLSDILAHIARVLGVWVPKDSKNDY